MFVVRHVEIRWGSAGPILLTAGVARTRIRRRPEGVVLAVPVAAFVRSVAAGTARSILAGIGLGVAESESNFAGGSHGEDRLGLGREVVPDLGDRMELAGDRLHRPGVADVVSMAEKRRRIVAARFVADPEVGVVDSCLDRWPEGKCRPVGEEHRERPRRIRWKLLAECEAHLMEERSEPDSGKMFDPEPGWIGWCKSGRQLFGLTERWPVELVDWERWSGWK